MTNIKDDEAERMRVRARKTEQQWRAAHDIAKKGPLPEKPQPKRSRQPVSRREAERREQRRRQWIEHQALREPLLKGVE